MNNATVSNLLSLILGAVVMYSGGNARAEAVDGVAFDGIAFVDCGSTSNGLSVQAASVQPRQLSCPRAGLVGERYLRAVRKKAFASVRISVNGAIWICRERLYDTNPVTECAMRNRPRELVRLVS